MDRTNSLDFKELTGLSFPKWSKQWGISLHSVRNSWKRGYSLLPPKGKHSHPLYNTYKGMLERCYNKHHPAYGYYGGRGIYVCGRWFYSFDNFVSDMGHRPFSGAQLDRQNNDGPYSPDNVSWVTRGQNISNRRFLGRKSNYTFHTPMGKYRTLAEVAKVYKRSIPTVCGWFSDNPRLKRDNFFKEVLSIEIGTIESHQSPVRATLDNINRRG